MASDNSHNEQAVEWECSLCSVLLVYGIEEEEAAVNPLLCNGSIGIVFPSL